MNDLLQLGFNGLVTGSIIAIGAVGVSLVMAVLDIGSFAHGDYMTVGAYAGLTVDVYFRGNIVTAILAAIIIVAAFGAALDFLIIQRFTYRSGGSIFIITLGLALVIRYLVFFFAGVNPQAYLIDQTQVFVVGPIRCTPAQLGVIAGAGVSIVAIATLLQRTRLGMSMRAVAGSRDLAAISGIDTKRIRLYVWLIGSGLAGLAGVMLALVETEFNPTIGYDVLFLLFTAVILGGIGSVYGTLVGALILGLCMELSTSSALFGGLSSAYKPVVAYVILLTLLYLRPQGLFGRSRLI